MAKKQELIVEEVATTDVYTVIHSGEAEKISPHSKGLLTFDIGKHNETHDLAIRLTGNGDGGLFSHEWIMLNDVHAILEKQEESFSSRLFRPLFGQGSTNNAGFLAAVLRSPDVCLIEADTDKLFSHRCYPDWQHRFEQIGSSVEE